MITDEFNVDYSRRLHFMYQAYSHKHATTATLYQFVAGSNRLYCSSIGNTYKNF